MERKGLYCGAIVVCVLVAALCQAQKPQYGGGTGVSSDPYLIGTPEHLQTVGVNPDHWNEHFTLTADIDLSAHGDGELSTIGDDDRPFSGTFDGDGHTISGMRLTSNHETWIGLFGVLDGQDARIENLTLVAPVVKDDGASAGATGALVGKLERGTVYRCAVEDGSVTGEGRVGALVGANNGSVVDCYTTGHVTGTEETGGLIGASSRQGYVRNCWSAATVIGTAGVGGLVGTNGGDLQRCCSTGSVTGTTDVGGLVGTGDANGRIADCYSTATVVGTEYVGGLAGCAYGDLERCYSTGAVAGEICVGGLVGLSSWVDIVDCFWDIETSGLTTSSGGQGTTTAHMQSLYTFLAWGRSENPLWTLDEGRDYPHLKWEGASGSAIMSLNVADLLVGNGTPADPYLIYSPEEMNLIGADTSLWDKHYRLMADLDFAAYASSEFNLIGYHDPHDASWILPKESGTVPFTGVFDGNGHTIANFRYESQDSSVDYLGLFAYVNDPNAGIRNLGLIAPRTDQGAFTCEAMGTLVGWIGEGTIQDCYAVDVQVSGSYDVGGLIGHADSATLTDCHVSGTVTGHEGVGGLAGYAILDEDNGGEAAITICSADVVVTGQNYVGGLIGANHIPLAACRSGGAVTGVTYVGGLVGINQSPVHNCYADGEVTGEDSVGGLLGLNATDVRDRRSRDPEASPRIVNCYATGRVEGIAHTGGLFGNGSGDASQCFWDVQETSQFHSEGGTGGTTAELQTVSTFYAWATPDNAGVWTISDGNDYPRLWWEEKPGQVIEPWYPSGSGTPEDPFLIRTVDELLSMAALTTQWSQCFRLMTDIDLSDHAGIFGAIGTEDTPFTGVFDGAGHTISNFHCSTAEDVNNPDDNTRCAGLFGHVDDPNAVVKNLGMIDPHVDAPADSRVGALIRSLDSGTISGCFTRGGHIVGRFYVGALVGDNGGIIENCYGASEVIGVSYAAGLVGMSGGTVINSYATGRVEGTSETSGLVANQPQRSGGDHAVIGSFWDIETTGQATSNAGTGLPTVEMQTAAPFLAAGWDFIGEAENGVENVWWIREGQDYPRLWWEPATSN